MKNDTRNRISYWYASAPVRCGVLVCFIAQLGLTPLAAFADVGLPPPAVHQTTNNGFPSSQALKNQGYDPSTGVFRVDERNRGTSTVTKTGDTITGQQQKTVTATGNYGEKGTMPTSVTQKTSVSKLSTFANAAFIGSIAGQNQSNYARQLGQDLANGDFLSAATNAMHMAGQIFDNMTGGIAGSLYDGYKGLPDLSKAADNFNKEIYGSSPSKQAEQLEQLSKKLEEQQRQSERNGDLRGSIAQEVAKKAFQGAGNAIKNTIGSTKLGSQLAEESRNKDGSYSQLYLRRIDIASTSYKPKPTIKGYSYQIDKYNGIYNWTSKSHSAFNKYFPDLQLPEGYGEAAGIQYSPITSEAEYQEALRKVQGQNPQQQQKTVEDMTLNEQDIQKILERMLESQQTNHKELMEQLSKFGDIVEKSTTSKEFTPSVSYSEPYTPAGSDTPQQTRFEIDKNGNITTSTVSRPDLKPNSSQAPTRSVVIPNKSQTGQQTGQKETGENTTPTTGETGQQIPTTGQTNQQNQQQKEFCEKNPNSAACAELGEADYEDLSVPESNIDLKLQPMDIFSTDGTCPANPSFSLGALGTFEIPYDYFCNIARLLRPILILGTIIMCGFFAYNAVKEL